jgi:hypothetical protein
MNKEKIGNRENGNQKKLPKQADFLKTVRGISPQ